MTPRIALTHTTGFPNWRFFRRDGKLVFERAPGAGYGYSGEGFQSLARFAEKKLGKPFPALVDEMVLKPVGMAHTNFTVRAEDADTIARLPHTILYGVFLPAWTVALIWSLTVSSVPGTDYIATK